MAKIEENREIQDSNHRLTLRDVEILGHLAKKQFASISDIKEKFFAGKSNRNYYRRLYTLKEMGYIASLIGDGGNKLGYRLSKKGIQWLKAQRHPGLEVAPQAFFKTTFDHDSKLNRIQDIFEENSLVSDYWPEHRVRSELGRQHGHKEKRDEGYKVPDALFKLKTPRGQFRVAFELECSRKNFKRYRRLVRALSITPDADLVFIACDNSQIMLILKTLLAEAREKDPFVRISKKDNGFYFILTENLLREGRNALFEGEGKSFSLASLEKEISMIKRQR